MQIGSIVFCIRSIALEAAFLLLVAKYGCIGGRVTFECGLSSVITRLTLTPDSSRT